MKDIYCEVGEAIRAKRVRRGLTLEDLAELSNLHPSYIGQIERNKKKASLETVGALARALGVPVSVLFAAVAPEGPPLFSDQLNPLLRSASAAKRKLMIDVLRRLAKGLRAFN
jgi:transcriptional regulator with XRE-family HTH domain